MSNITSILVSVVGILFLVAASVFLIGLCALFIKMVVRIWHDWN